MYLFFKFRHFRNIFGRFPIEFWTIVVVYRDRAKMKYRQNENGNSYEL